jgi:hypothetical protein
MRLGKLEAIRIVGGSSKANEEVSFEDFVGDQESGLEGMISEDRVACGEMMRLYDTLSAFKASVGRYGLTRSLVSFADYAKELSSEIPEIPAIEGLVADKSAKNSVDVVAAVEVKMATLIEFMKQSIKDAIKNLFKRGRYKLGDLSMQDRKLSTLEEILHRDNLVFDKEEAAKKMIRAPKHDEMMHDLHLIGELSKVFADISSKPIPHTQAEYGPWMESIASRLKPVETICRYTTRDGRVVRTETSGLGRKSYPKASLESLGYDSLEKYHEILALYRSVCNQLSEDYRNYVESRMFEGHVPEDTNDHVVNMSFDVVCSIFENVDWAMGWMDEYPFRIMKAIFWCTDKKKD